MDDMQKTAPRPRSIDAAARLAGSWPVLVVAALALLFLDLRLGGSGLMAILALSVIVAIAALFGPRGTQPLTDEGQRTGEHGIDGLPAVQLAAAVPDPLYVIDRDGGLIFANAAAIGAFGAIAPGTSLQLKFRAPEMHDLIHRVLQEGVAGGTDYAERVPVERVYRVSATPIGEGTGLFVLLFKDQSEARRIDRMRSDFIANASHELRTPLASVAGFIETLRGPARDDPAARDNFLDIMQQQTGRMARLIDDLLSLSRLEVRPHISSDRKVDIAGLLASVTDSLDHLAGESGVRIELNVPAGALEVAGDRDELVQVFENLVENACKYGGSGGRVVVSAERLESGEVSATVQDFGPGIPEEHIPRITERFYRVDVETSRAQKGTGLGLAIVKHILTRHGARLAIRSRVGEGSAFIVRFPPSA